VEGKGKGAGYIVHYEGLKELFNLISEEYKVIAPKLEEGVIKYKQVKSLEELPFGAKSEELAGFYSVVEGSGYFSYPRPANSIKEFLHPPRLVLFTVRRKEKGLEFEHDFPEERLCFFDVRACDLYALGVLDRVFVENNPHPDTYYSALREKVFIVAVNCTGFTQVCFCSTMATGPFHREGYDLLLTEMEGYFLLEIGSDKGKAFVERLRDKREAKAEAFKKKEELMKALESKMLKHFELEQLPAKLYSRMDEEHWVCMDKRCFACTSCTQVCPTCFCFDILEENHISMQESKRVRVWDSCFSPSFATVHRFNLRQSVHSRYRQWLMHKFAYWIDQFGTFGCVGCGRCITWCPAGIDIRQEVKRLAST